MQYRRTKRPGGCYFFTLVTHQRQKILTYPENIQRLRAAIKREQAKNPFTIDAIVILPDHLHCLWTLPPKDADYSGKWSRIKRYFSIGCVGADKYTPDSRLKKREKAVWQRRFWEHAIRDEDDWRRHMDYIHYNPVKHGYANAPKQWLHGSFKRCVEKGWYTEDWGNLEPESIKNMNPE